MRRRNARMEVTKTFTYLEDYDEEWERVSELYEEYGSDAEEFEEQQEKMQKALAEKSVEAAKDAMRSTLESAIEEAEYTVENIVVYNNGTNDYEVTAEVKFPNVSPGFTPDDRFESRLENRFDTHQMI